MGVKIRAPFRVRVGPTFTPTLPPLDPRGCQKSAPLGSTRAHLLRTTGAQGKKRGGRHPAQRAPNFDTNRAQGSEHGCRHLQGAQGRERGCQNQAPLQGPRGGSMGLKVRGAKMGPLGFLLWAVKSRKPAGEWPMIAQVGASLGGRGGFQNRSQAILPGCKVAS